MDGKQHAVAFQGVVVLVQDESHAHCAGLFQVGDQEVGADVQLAVVFFVKTRGLFNVLVHRVFGNLHAEMLADPAFFFRCGRLQIDPNGVELGQLFLGRDFLLKQAAIGQRKDIEHGDLSAR